MPGVTKNVPFTMLCDDWRFFCLEIPVCRISIENEYIRGGILPVGFVRVFYMSARITVWKILRSAPICLPAICPGCLSRTSVCRSVIILQEAKEANKVVTRKHNISLHKSVGGWMQEILYPQLKRAGTDLGFEQIMMLIYILLVLISLASVS